MAKKKKVYERIKMKDTLVGDKIQFIETPDGRPIHNNIVYTRVFPSESLRRNFLTFEKDGKEAPAYLETDNIETQEYEVLLIERAKQKVKEQGRLF